MKNVLLTGIRVAGPQSIPPAGCSITPDGLVRGRGGAVVSAPQRGLMRRPIPSRGGQLEIAGVVVGSWGPNYGQPGRLPQPLQGAPQRRIPPQVGSVRLRRSCKYNHASYTMAALHLAQSHALYIGRKPNPAAGEAFVSANFDELSSFNPSLAADLGSVEFAIP